MSFHEFGNHDPSLLGGVLDNAVDFVHFNFLFCVELRFDNRFWSVELNWFFDVKDRFGKRSILENAFQISCLIGNGFRPVVK